MTSTRPFPLVLTCAALAALGACTEDEPVPDAPRAQQIVVRGLDYAYAVEEGMTMQEFAEALQDGGDPGQYLDGTIGILIVGPGQTSRGRLSVDLEAGRTYLLACNFQDTPDAPHHVDLGMIQALTVPPES